MWAVWMELGVAWLDHRFRVVDTCLAKPWRLYFPKAPAMYILEGPSSMLQSVAVGDELEISDAAKIPPSGP